MYSALDRHITKEQTPSRTRRLNRKVSPLTSIAEVPHPLANYEAPICFSWEQWRQAWEETQYLQGRLGLLHGIFDVYAPQDSYMGVSDRIRFLLRLADGWSQNRGGNDSPERQLCMKAADVLANRFFARPEKTMDDRRDFANRNADFHLWWREALTQSFVSEDLAWFFRPQELHDTLHDPVLNFAESYSKKLSAVTIRRAGRALTQLAWGFNDGKWMRHDTLLSHTERLATVRLDLLHLLLACGDVQLLLTRGYPVDEAARQRLHELALQKHFLGRGWDKEDPTFKSIEEAEEAGSEAARVLLLLEMRNRYETTKTTVG